MRAYRQRLVFPWTGAISRFYKAYGRLVREGGLVQRLTQRERDILHGTAIGKSEAVLARELGCCLGNIRKYRQRLREKLGIRGTWSIRTLVARARDGGLIDGGHSGTNS